MGKRSITFVHNITNLAYILVSIILFAIAFVIIIWSVWQIGVDLFYGNPSQKGELLYKVMDEVAFIIFSIAVVPIII